MTDPLKVAEALATMKPAEQPYEAQKLMRQAAQIIREQQSQIDAKDFALRNGKSLAEDAMHAVREMLREQGVPEAAFIDDHVANAIVQRNQAQAHIADMTEVFEKWECPRPANGRADDLTIGQCLDFGECGCAAQVCRARSLVGRAGNEA